MSEGRAADGAYLGTVLSTQANYYQVHLDNVWESGPAPIAQGKGENASPFSLLCTRRALLKKTGQRVMVGDRVEIAKPDGISQRGVITKVLPRQTVLDRPPVANANQILLVFALQEPELDVNQLSQFLVKAETTDLSVQLCLNKSDLVSAHHQAQWRDRLIQWGYPPLFVSARQDSQLQDLKATLRGRITVVCGPSGVGKSSLINRLIPTADLRVGAVSGKLNRGRHTTRHVELFELPESGLLADTPGFNQPDITSAPTAIASYFPEARPQIEHCQFGDCLHRDEPGCAVRGDWERYPNYLAVLEQAIAHHQALEKRRKSESTLKVKAKGAGQRQEEPKLLAKRYRRSSRRTQQQELQTLYQDAEDQLDLDGVAEWRDEFR